VKGGSFTAVPAFLFLQVPAVSYFYDFQVLGDGGLVVLVLLRWQLAEKNTKNPRTFFSGTARILGNGFEDSFN
jgi:hypothetical protein